MSLPELQSDSVEFVGPLVFLKTGACERRQMLDSLRFKLMRASASGIAFVVQAGLRDPLLYQLYHLPSAPLGEGIRLAVAAGFLPEEYEGQPEELCREVTSLVTSLESAGHLQLCEVGVSHIMLEAGKGQTISAKDARSVIDFCVKRFGVEFRDVARSSYVNQFQTMGFLIVGTTY